MSKKRTTERQAEATLDIGDDLVIAHRRRRTGVPGTWAKGTLNGHRFEALVFSEHAESPEYELDDSRISKLWVQSLDNRNVVASFDRGWDVHPTTPIAQAIVDFLAAGLADYIYHD